MTDCLKKMNWRAWLVSGMLFLYPALALTTRYGLGAMEVVFLAVAGAVAAPLWHHRKKLFGSAKWIVIAFVFNFGVAMASAWWTEFHLNTIDNPFREMLAVAAIGLLAYAKPKAEWFWYGLFAGTIGVACIALYQRFGLNVDRAGGFHQIIMFGDISIAMGLMALASIPRFAKTKLALLPYIAFLCGFIASILSGSRGGWVSLLLLFIPVYLSGRRPSIGKMMLVLLTIACLSVAAYFIPQTGVRERFAAISSDIHQYERGTVYTSIGLRFEMWKGAWKIFGEHPLIGVGRANFNRGLKDLISRNEVAPDVQNFHHAHNEMLNALATEGLFGACALLLIYGAPLAFFIRSMRREWTGRPYAMAGALLVLSFVWSGMTQVLFSHHVGAAFYALTVSVLAGLCVMMERART